MTFFPFVSSYSQDFIEIDFNFKNTSSLSISDQATYIVKFKELSILRDKLLYLPLTEKSFQNEEPFAVGPVPALIYDKKTAEVIVQTATVAT